MPQPPEISAAIQRYKQDRLAESRQILRDYLVAQLGNVEGLLWLAKVTTDSREAIAAAELALALEPENEIAKRAVVAVHAKSESEQKAESPIDIMRVTGMTLAQARAVKWPFNGLNRQIGVLLDESDVAPDYRSKPLTLHNLAWAFENEKVWSSDIKQAARTLLLSRLLGDRLREPLPPLTVIEGAGYSAYQERKSLVGGGLVYGLGFAAITVAVVVLVISILLALSQGKPPLLNLRAMLIAFGLLLLAYGVTKVGDRLAERGRQYRAGREGESKVVDALRASLTQPWTLIHNMEWTDRQWGDVDLILLGPGGVWAFEIKAFSGEYRVNGDRWQYKSRWGWRAMRKDPGAQARRNARNVKDYLDLNGANVKWVQPVVVWAGEDKRLTVDAPSTPVWRLSELSDRTEEFWQGHRLSDDQIQRAVAILNETVEKVKAKAAGKRAET
jgi:hypothetical protein